MTDNSPLDPIERFSQAILAFEEGRYDEAIEHYSTLVAEEPDEFHYHFGLAMTFVEAGHYEAARLPFTMALELNPDDEQTHHNYGNLLLNHLNMPHEALPHLRRAVELDPKGGGYQLDLGRCWKRCNQDEYAGRAFQAEIDSSAIEGLMALDAQDIRNAVPPLNRVWQATFHAQHTVAEMALLVEVFDQASRIGTPTCKGLADQCRARLELFRYTRGAYPEGEEIQPMRLTIV